MGRGRRLASVTGLLLSPEAERDDCDVASSRDRGDHTLSSRPGARAAQGRNLLRRSNAEAQVGRNR